MISIIVDSRETRAYFSRLLGRLQDMRTPNRRASKILHNLILGTFDKQMTPWGSRWKKLRPSTLRWRKQKGYAPGPALKASGYLRSSIRPTSGRAGFTVDANAPYADIQQEGNAANRMYGRGHAPIPARPFMPVKRGSVNLPQPWWDAVLEPFNNIVRDV